MELAPRARLLILGVAGVGLLAAAAAIVVTQRTPRAGRPRGAVVIPGEGPGGRVVVEVLNASGRVGLARAATRRLRAAGVDVVYFGSDAASGLDSTEVLVRRGDAGAGRRVRRALGAGLVRAAPDPARLVDVTVRLGGDFAGLVGREP